MNKENVIIIGSGIAALTLASRLYTHKNVIVLTKSKWNQNNSAKAQGGIAAAIAPTDNWEKHMEDTMVAGCHYNNEMAVKLLVTRGPLLLKQLISNGLAFDCNTKGGFALGQEGAHQEKRILHAGGDATGKAIIDFLYHQVKEKVSFIEDVTVLDLIMEDKRCIGVWTSNQNEDRRAFYANHVVLATGGCGALYEVTSNHPTIVGDGLALAYRAGASLTDLEFIQFHPTMLYTKNHCYGLISEAVRGEGAILVTEYGERIMEGKHPQKDLAPRDVVAREIRNYMNKGVKVFLDITTITDFKQKFPTITRLCEKANIDIAYGKLPVAPGAHFLMGGIKTNLNGQTTLPGLYAIGEVACNGVHGANRLASNSLLEGIVYPNILADYILTLPDRNRVEKSRKIASCCQSAKYKQKPLFPTKQEINHVMTRYVGIERTKEGLLYARKWMEQFDFPLTNDREIVNYNDKELDIINMLTTGWLIITSALQRSESRGGHFRLDYPYSKEEWNKCDIVRHNQEVLSNIERKQLSGVGK